MEKHQSKKWIVAELIPETISRSLEMFPFPIRQILYNRRIEDPEAAQNYLEARIGFEDPFALLGMKKAVERISKSITQNEAIAIYGDYDVDGVTATALLVEVIQALGGRVRGYIPNRFEEGYGLNNEALDLLGNEGVKLVITVDCGIRSLVEVEHAQVVGIDVIISDHHYPKGDVPAAYAVICPKQAGDEYPNKDLAGVGLAYKIAEGLIQTHSNNQLDIEKWLDLVALGTVADIVPLTGENRGLVRKGINVIRNNPRPGLKSLANMAGVTLVRVNASDIGFMLAPRLNAAGRLESALNALNLLLADSMEVAAEYALKLEAQNRERQNTTKAIQMAAEILAEADPEAYLIFAADPEFNQGIVGLAASKLVESYYRPAIVAYQGPDTTRGSCRSIPEFHITEALDEVSDLLIRHGGHAMAAGFTVSNDRLDDFVSRMKEIARQKLSSLDLQPMIKIDIEIQLRGLKPELLPFLDQMQPTGQDNPEPAFVSKNLKVIQKRIVGADQSHLRMVLSDGLITFDAIGFRMARHLPTIKESVDVVYNFSKNTFNDRTTLQLMIRDLKPSQREQAKG
jgi:single-stranded-DNA-specific exonuclease